MCVCMRGKGEGDMRYEIFSRWLRFCFILFHSCSFNTLFEFGSDLGEVGVVLFAFFRLIDSPQLLAEVLVLIVVVPAFFP